MLKIIIGLPMLFIFICMIITFFQFMVEDLHFPKFMIIIGLICWVIFGVVLIILISYIVGGAVLGG